MGNTEAMNFIWETKDEGKIRLKDMDEFHLINTFRLVQRQTKKYAEALDHFPSFQGEMAQLHAERMYGIAFKRYHYLKSTLGVIKKACKIRNIKLK